LAINKKGELKIMFPHPPGGGGPGSFQIKFENKLKKNGWTITYADDNQNTDLIFVVGGTRKLGWLWKMRRKGVPIIYRLDGISWLHKKKKVSLKYYFTAEIRNYTTKLIHGFLATKIVYQSQFVHNWWDKEGWRKRKNTSIIHNGVNLPKEHSVQNAIDSRHKKRLVVLEGTIDYSPYAVKLLNDLAERLPKDISIELYGKFEDKIQEQRLDCRIEYKGFLQRNEVYDKMLGSVYLSLDINPACPNTVAEALACGAPVVAFDTGALPELVDTSCGKVVPYGSNPWDLEYPDVHSLIKSIIEVFEKYDTYSKAASKKAIENYTLDIMFKKYNATLENALKLIKE
jgi:glycosyltransferase involved in cell wall biosynthesis